MITPLPPHGTVDLLNSAANDLDVVNAARVSYNQESLELDERGKGLIRYLMNQRHGTPFEHNFFKFRVRAPIFVLREWQRHRIGWSYNEQSGRYSELDLDFYIPETLRTQVGKPGAYTFEPYEDEYADELIKGINTVYNHAKYQYNWLLENGIAKEQARLVLPVALYSTMICSCNARGLMNFISLRNSEQAMEEIRQYAAALEIYLKFTMPVTYEAFIRNNRQAP